jgi:glycerophosphoryl diester phosphodiesterase
MGCVSVLGDDAPLPLIHAHAHNDYEHTHPLFDALSHGIASVEADIHLVDGKLLVAHDRKKVKPELTLQALYLDPLRARAKQFGGHIYPNGDPTFYLLIDTKSDTNATWIALRQVLEGYSDILTKFSGDAVERKAVTVVLTGNRPRALLPMETVRLAGLDGQMPDLARPNPHGIFIWMSEDWRNFFKWNGKGTIPPGEKAHLLDIVAKSHERNMKVRFWDAPQSTDFWAELRADGVDLLNADDLPGVEKFLRTEDAGASK